MYLYMKYKVYSYPVKQTKLYYTKRKGNICRSPLEIITFVFGDHTIHHLTCTALLLDCQRQRSNSFVCRWRSFPLKDNKRRCPPEIITFVFGHHTIHHLTCTALLLDCQRQCSNSFVCRWRSFPLKDNKCRSPPEIITFVFGDHTIHHLICTAVLLDCQRQHSNSSVCRWRSFPLKDLCIQVTQNQSWRWNLSLWHTTFYNTWRTYRY